MVTTTRCSGLTTRRLHQMAQKKTLNYNGKLNCRQHWIALKLIGKIRSACIKTVLFVTCRFVISRDSALSSLFPNQQFELPHLKMAVCLDGGSYKVTVLGVVVCSHDRSIRATYEVVTNVIWTEGFGKTSKITQTQIFRYGTHSNNCDFTHIR